LKPAGTNTAFNPAQVYFVASHQEINANEGVTMDDEKKEELEEVKEVEEEKKEGEVEAPDMSAEVMQAEMTAKLATMQAELEKSVAEKAQLEANVKELQSKLDASVAEKNELKASLRKKELTPYFTDEDFADQRDELIAMTDKQFHVLKASLNKVKPLEVGVYVPERSNDGGKPPLALK
jgi:regulator of replication initiation timing